MASRRWYHGVVSAVALILIVTVSTAQLVVAKTFPTTGSLVRTVGGLHSQQQLENLTTEAELRQLVEAQLAASFNREHSNVKQAQATGEMRYKQRVRKHT